MKVEQLLLEHDVNTCRACKNLMQRPGMTIGKAMEHAKQYPSIHGSYSTNTKGRTIKKHK